MIRLLLVLCIAALSGCAANVIQTPSSQQAPGAPAKAQPAGGTVVLLVTSPSMQSSGDWESFVDDWRTAMATSAARSQLSFLFVRNEAEIGARTGTLVRITVYHFRYQSQFARFMIGILAGNSSMDVNAEYLELPSRKIVGSKRFNTASSAGQGIFSAATPRQVEAVSDQIVRDITGKK